MQKTKEDLEEEGKIKKEAKACKVTLELDNMEIPYEYEPHKQAVYIKEGISG